MILPKILINAYAVSPGMGSEPGMGWNWCIHLANHCELHIITEGEFRERIEEALLTLPQAQNMHFYYKPVSDEVRQMCWNQGDWRFYKHYKKWQYQTSELAKDIVVRENIDILHQLNMIGFREPGYLWEIAGIPFVWGPVDAKESFPVAYLQGADVKTKLFVRLKNTITKWQLRNSTRVRKAVEGAAVVISSSSNAQAAFKKFFQLNSPLLNETGCYIQNHELIDKREKKYFDVLWVGKLDFRKQLSIALRSIATVNDANIRLHIVGAGDTGAYKLEAERLGIGAQCNWHGKIAHNEVQALMKDSDLFFFTSVAEGTPHVVLEAIANNLPVLCFDTCGQGDTVNDRVGRKVALSTPDNSIEDFAGEINDLYSDRETLKQMSQNCSERQKELSWESKALHMLELYKDALAKTKNQQEDVLQN